MRGIFSPTSPYTKQARFIAVLWTLLILAGCFMPAANVPRVDVPLADKWVHFTFFAGFTFLWLCAKPVTKPLWLFSMLSMGVAFGSLIELLQGAIPTLGRAAEVMDAVADSIGGLIGITIFAVCGAVVRHR